MRRQLRHLNRNRERDEDAEAQVIAERDEAIAERDFIRKFLQDLGVALVGDAAGCCGSPTSRPARDGPPRRRRVTTRLSPQRPRCNMPNL